MIEKLKTIREALKFSKTSFVKIGKVDDIDRMIAISSINSLEESLTLLDEITATLESEGEYVKIPKGITKIGTGYVKVEQQGDRASLDVSFINPDRESDKVLRRESFLFPAINTIKGKA